jgi:lambda family phage portal protein
VAYHVKNTHPGDNRGLTPGTERVPADELVHLFVPERAEQVRAHTWLHAVIIDAGMLNRFGNSALVAAEVGAAKMGVFTRKEDADPSALSTVADSESEGALQMSAEAGEFIELPAGYALESWDPQYPNEVFDSFVNTFMRRIASGLDVAEHNLSGNMTGVNYSSARIAELAERDVWLTLQQWLIDACVMPIYAEWLQWSLMRGDVRFPATGKALPFDKLDKFLDASFFRGRRWKWVDPAKEVAAAREAVDARLASRTQIAAEQGIELDDLIAELAAEQQMLAAAGLTPTASAPAPAPAPAAEDTAS